LLRNRKPIHDAIALRGGQQDRRHTWQGFERIKRIKKLGRTKESPSNKMLPASYPKILKAHLSESQYITVQLLLLLLQQPIQADSRRKNLRRFLSLPQLNLKLLWLPLIKYWISQVDKGRGLNRKQRRYRMKLKSKNQGFWIVAMDRTEWKNRNIFMVTIVWGTHAIPIG